MSPLEKAQLRLDQALVRLEQTLTETSGLGGSAGALPPGLDTEVQALRVECDALRRQLQASFERHARLQAVIGEVGGKLDTAIGELDDLLER